MKLSDINMSGNKIVIEGIGIPIRDYDCEGILCLDKVKVNGVENDMYIIDITDFFDEHAPMCASYGEVCSLKDIKCKHRVNDICKPPIYKFKITVEFERVK